MSDFTKIERTPVGIVLKWSAKDAAGSVQVDLPDPMAKAFVDSQSKHDLMIEALSKGRVLALSSTNMLDWEQWVDEYVYPALGINV